MTVDPTVEAHRLAAARVAFDKMFEELVAPYRRELGAHCYRMLGSLADAEDLMQETLLRAWRGLPAFEGRSSLRGWLYKIATNACLDSLTRRANRVLPSEIGAPSDPWVALLPSSELRFLDPAPDSIWQAAVPGPEACYSARESVTLAFMVALQELPPSQRAVLILRDVLGWSAAEAADLLDLTVAAVNSALQRARATLKERQSRPSAGAEMRDPEADRPLLTRYMRAWETGDPSALVALLREDALFTMPPVPAWFRGRDAVGAVLAGIVAQVGAVRMIETSAAGTAAFGVYVRAPGAMRFRAASLHVPRFDGISLVELHAFLDPDLFPRFDLPADLD